MLSELRSFRRVVLPDHGPRVILRRSGEGTNGDPTMGSQLRSIALNLCAALIALSAAYGANSQQTLKDSPSQAISEFKMSGNVWPLSRAIGQLTGQPRGSLLADCSTILNTLYEAADPAFDKDRVPLLNIAPGGRYSSGIDPEYIKEPQLKAEYQKKLDSNREYAEYYSQQSRIYGTIDQTAEVLRLNFKEASVGELVNLLVKSGMNASYSDAFLKRMATQVP